MLVGLNNLEVAVKITNEGFARLHRNDLASKQCSRRSSFEEKNRVYF